VVFTQNKATKYAIAAPEHEKRDAEAFFPNSLSYIFEA